MDSRALSAFLFMFLWEGRAKNISLVTTVELLLNVSPIFLLIENGAVVCLKQKQLKPSINPFIEDRIQFVG